MKSPPVPGKGSAADEDDMTTLYRPWNQIHLRPKPAPTYDFQLVKASAGELIDALPGRTDYEYITMLVDEFRHQGLDRGGADLALWAAASLRREAATRRAMGDAA
jgi:hypothetical protein